MLAPDLRGHGRSGYEPPWTFATHVADPVETLDALEIDSAAWVGHSFGGRLTLELAAAHPERVRRAVLLDPAIQVLPHIAEVVAEQERSEPVYDSPEDYADRREDSPPRELVLEDCSTASSFPTDACAAEPPSRRSSRSTASSHPPHPRPTRCVLRPS